MEIKITIELGKIENTSPEYNPPITLETSYNNKDLKRDEEKAQVLSMYRELNEINKISIFSRIEGMLEAQTYQMSDK